MLASGNKKLDDPQIMFIREYIKATQDITATLPKRLQQDIVDFIGKIKEKEHTYLVEVTPRMVAGFERRRHQPGGAHHL